MKQSIKFLIIILSFFNIFILKPSDISEPKLTGLLPSFSASLEEFHIDQILKHEESDTETYFEASLVKIGFVGDEKVVIKIYVNLDDYEFSATLEINNKTFKLDTSVADHWHDKLLRFIKEKNQNDNENQKKVSKEIKSKKTKTNFEFIKFQKYLIDPNLKITLPQFNHSIEKISVSSKIFKWSGYYPKLVFLGTFSLTIIKEYNTKQHIFIGKLNLTNETINLSTEESIKLHHILIKNSKALKEYEEKLSWNSFNPTFDKTEHLYDEELKN